MHDLHALCPRGPFLWVCRYHWRRTLLTQLLHTKALAQGACPPGRTSIWSPEKSSVGSVASFPLTATGSRPRHSNHTAPSGSTRSRTWRRDTSLRMMTRSQPLSLPHARNAGEQVNSCWSPDALLCSTRHKSFWHLNQPLSTSMVWLPQSGANTALVLTAYLRQLNPPPCSY